MSEFDKPVIVTLSEHAVPYTVYDSLWIPCSAKFLTVGVAPNQTSGIIEIYEVDDATIVERKKIKTESPLKCGTFSASSIRHRHLATGSLNGRLNIWDIEHSTSPIYSVDGHDEQAISSIDGVAGDSTGCGAPEIVTGGADGVIKVWDPRQKEKHVAMMTPLDNNFRACWAVAFGNSYNSQERYVCGGFDNGDVRMFDLRAMKVTWEYTVDSGVCALEFDRKTIEMNKFVAVGLDGLVCLFEARNRDDNFGRQERQAHENSTVWCVKHLPQNRDVFVTCGGSGSLCLWKYCNWSEDDLRGTLNQMQTTKISTQPVYSIDWCPDKNGLAVCVSADQTVRLLYLSKLNQL